MKWQLEGKPHWPLTTYEKLWGLWNFTGIPLTIGLSMILGSLAILSISPSIMIFFPGPFLGFIGVFGILFVFLGLLQIFDWWQLIHGTVPDPHPFARPLAYMMNEPDPWKEHAELQARLDEQKILEKQREMETKQE